MSIISPIISSITAPIVDDVVEGGWPPSRLFTGGVKGVAYDFTLAAYLYQDSARTTPVTAVSDPIGSVTDISGNSVHASQATAINRPTFEGYATFDGSNGALQTSAIDFSGTDKVTVIIGMRKSSDAAQGVVVELSAALGSNNGTFLLYAPRSAAVPGYQWFSKGTTAVAVTVDVGHAAPVTAVLTGIGNIAGDASTLRSNGTQIGTNNADQGTGNFGNFALNIGARNNASLRLNGRIYRMIVIGRLLTAGELAEAEAWAGDTFQ